MSSIKDFIPSKKIITNRNHRFKFSKLCPYCKADLIYRGVSWGRTFEGEHYIKEYDVKCINEPEFLGSKEWDYWFRTHCVSIDKIQAFTDKKVLDFLFKKYTFQL